MKKRRLALVLGLFLVLQQEGAFAVDMKRYQEFDGAYQIAYPAGWRTIDKHSVAKLIEQIEAGELNYSGMTLEAIRDYQTTLNNEPFVLITDDSTSNNLIIAYGSLSPQERIGTRAFLDQAGPLLNARMKTLLPDHEPLDSGSMVTLGDYQYAHLSARATMGGLKSQQHRYILLLGERIYFLTFTFRLTDNKMPPEAEEIMIKMVESFRAN